METIHFRQTFFNETQENLNSNESCSPNGAFIHIAILPCPNHSSDPFIFALLYLLRQVVSVPMG